MKLAPNFRIPFGHKHEGQEEVYVIVRGSARIKVEDEIVELGEWDAIRFDKDTMRNVEAGPEGVEYLAFGAGDDPTDAEMVPGWWSRLAALAYRKDQGRIRVMPDTAAARRRSIV